MLLKSVVGVAGGFAIDHFLKSDGLVVTATLALGLAALPTTFSLPLLSGGLGHAILADSFFLVGNFPTSFQLGPESADCFVIDFGSVGNLPIALDRVSPQQLHHNFCPRFAVEVATMDVGADDVVASGSIIASEVRKPRRNLRILASAIAIVAVEDFALVADYRVMQAVKLDVTSEFVEVLRRDWRKQLRQIMRL